MMKTYHEIFAEPDGRWHIRIYSDDRVVHEEIGKAKDREDARAAALKAVQAWKGEKYDPRALNRKKSWWRIW